MFMVMIRACIALSAIVFTNNLFALSVFREPYLGIEAIQTNQDYKANFGEHVFKKNPQDYSVFGGFKFSKYFGLEAGYEFQPSKSKTTVLTGGQSTPGGPIIDPGDFDTVDGAFKGSMPYVGVFAGYDQKCSRVFCRVQWQALLAASFTHYTANTRVTAVNGSAFNGSLFEYDKTKTVAMVKLAVTGFVSKRIGVRLSADYRNTNQIHMPANFAPEQIKLKDTYGVGLGLVFAFA